MRLLLPSLTWNHPLSWESSRTDSDWLRYMGQIGEDEEALATGKAAAAESPSSSSPGGRFNSKYLAQVLDNGNAQQVISSVSELCLK